MVRQKPDELRKKRRQLSCFTVNENKPILKKTESCDFYHSRPHNLIIYKDVPYRRSNHRIYMNSAQPSPCSTSSQSSHYNFEPKSLSGRMRFKSSFMPSFGEIDEIRRTPSGRKLIPYNYDLDLGRTPVRSMSNQPLSSHSMH